MKRAGQARSAAARTAGAATLARKHRLESEVASFVRNPDEARFEKLALELFAYQFEAILPYQRLCRGQGQTPERVRTWRQIPAVPAEAWKAMALFAGDLEVERVRTFRSSGTTDPTRASQAHFSAGGLELMNLVVAEGARRALFAELGPRRLRLLVIAPAPEQAPHMIMGYGMAHLARVFGAEGSRFLVGANGLDAAALCAELRGCEADGGPVALVGSSFGFVAFFDWLEAHGQRLALPEGSRLMDAGGYKGRSREIGRREFVTWASARCGVPASRVVGDGELGFLRHLDLGNVERPAMIQSQDVARRVLVNGREGFEILGRAKGAEPRGCSLSADELGAASSSVGPASAARERRA